jgi:hypothetical protein
MANTEARSRAAEELTQKLAEMLAERSAEISGKMSQNGLELTMLFPTGPKGQGINSRLAEQSRDLLGLISQSML